MTDLPPSEPPVVAQPTQPLATTPSVAVLQPAAPPGWYPDASTGQKRWWDGTGWTERQQPASGGRGTAALVLGIVALALAAIPGLNWVGLVPALIAVILGAVGIFRPLSKMRSLIGLVLGGVALILTIVLGTVYAAVVFNGSNADQSASAQVQQPKAAPKPAASATPTAAPAPAGPTLTVSQQQAVIAAKGYLDDIGGFSYQGLIDQLSSSAGNGFSVADATAAVNSLNVDYNAQAVISAKSYLKLGGFSHASLVEQLSSPDGEKFTVAQAEYAVAQVGL